MSATRIILAAVVLGLSGAQGLAQSPGRAASSEPFEPAAARPKELDAKQLRQMYEDIAVFRTLLNRAVEKSYGVPLQAPAHGPHGPGAGFHPFSLAEGVYLPGRGVVYNLSAPPPAQGALGSEAGPASKAPSDWERARQELRGDKPAPPRDEKPRRPSLSESVLRLLAENGRHFKGLAGGEQITVAITFRGGDCIQCHTTLDGGKQPHTSNRNSLWMDRRTLAGYYTRSQLPETANVYQSAVKKPAVFRGGPVAAGFPSAVREHATVGDLHLRQGRNKEAAQAYSQALQALLNDVKPQKTEADVQRLLAAVEVTRKLTIALRAAGDAAGADRAREMSLKFANAAVKLAESLKGGKAEKGTIAVPERLIISAPKQLLEQAGAGKLSFADFRKAARVQYLRFPPSEK